MTTVKRTKRSIDYVWVFIDTLDKGNLLSYTSQKSIFEKDRC